VLNCITRLEDSNFNHGAEDSNFIAPSKAWERGTPNERMKPFEGIQLVKVQSG